MHVSWFSYYLSGHPGFSPLFERINRSRIALVDVIQHQSDCAPQNEVYHTNECIFAPSLFIPDILA